MLMNILEVLVRVMAPILSFTTDEVWECYPPAFRDIEGREASVQLAGWRARLRARPSRRRRRASGDHGGDDGRPRGGHQGAGRGPKREDHRQEPGGVAYRDGPGGAGGHGRLLRPGGLRGAVHCGQVQFVEGDGDEITAAVTVAEGEVPALLEHSRAGRQPNHPDVCERCGDALDAIQGGAE
ncbi:MAG: class I tRNA ligase family protein [Adlercreutzia equolifaciens]